MIEDWEKLLRDSQLTRDPAFLKNDPAAGGVSDMLYVAMFDEVDEGAAIFKVSDAPPTANGAKFIANEGLPGDHYLRLTGLAGRLFRGEMPVTDELPGLLPPLSP